MKPKPQTAESPGEGETPAILFDLDGTLADSNYQHVIAWQDAFRQEGVTASNARIHRRIGMSGDLLARAVLVETGHKPSTAKIERLEKIHKNNFARRLSSIRLLPGARNLLQHLSKAGVRWAIASSGDRKTILEIIRPLRVPARNPVVTGDDVKRAKPEPDIFLAAANRLGAALSDCIVVGDSIWDLLAARRAKALGIGVLSGGSGQAELEGAGAYRVYKDPADLLDRITEIGIPAK
jgi:HAD superfamily hydrolase (TIGR01509 family)